MNDADARSPYDVLLTGGTVIDPVSGVHERRDIAVRAGLIAANVPDIARASARSVRDVTGRVVLPGLIDVHGHFFHGIGAVPCRADDQCPRSGVTLGVDAGTAGWATFGVMRDYVIPAQRTRLKAWLNIASAGNLMKRILGTEFHDPRALDVDQTVAAIEENRDVIVGIKLRLDVTLQNHPDGLDSLDKAVRAARAAAVPMMVHSVHPPVPLPEILARMERGDVLTHAYNGRLDGILDDNQKIRRVVRDAYERGIVMDAGYAGGRLCSLRIARIAIEEGMAPQTLGTDAVNHATAPNPFFYSVSELVGLFHSLGMDLSSAVAAATSNPAAVIGCSDTYGSLAVGTSADISVFELVEEESVWYGEGDQIARGDRRLQPVATFVGGLPIWQAENTDA